jgi:CheY-like chemotaxis protein
VKQSGGHISVYSEIGHGTTFKLFFPHAEEAECPSTLTASTSVSGRGSETILLVEDDDQVHRVVGMMLQSRGYTVLEAVHGQAALELVQKTAEHIDLLITDMIMPVMSGAELADHLTRLNKTLNVLFFSGYTEHVMMKQGCQKNRAYVQKPITVDALARKVREILEAGTKVPS